MAFGRLRLKIQNESKKDFPFVASMCAYATKHVG